MIAREWKPWMWEMCPMTFADETNRDFVRWQWHWSMWPLVEMVGPGFVWSIGLGVLGYPPTWIDMVEETALVSEAVLSKLKEKHKWASI